MKKIQCKYNAFTPLPGVTEANDFKRDCKSQSETKIGGEFANICKQICPNFALLPVGPTPLWELWGLSIATVLYPFLRIWWREI